MSVVAGTNAERTLSDWSTMAGQFVSRYGLVVVLAWIGFGKYVKMESRVLIEHSPLMSWVYHVASVTTVARRWELLRSSRPYSLPPCLFRLAP